MEADLYTVLLVDDEPWVLKGMKMSFKWESMGFIVIAETTRATEAWDIICSKKPNVIFTDIRMPEITGLELVKKARDKGINSEFVIISGFADFAYAQEALKNSVFDYCLKPIKEADADEILTRLKKHLDKKKEINRYLKTCDKDNANAEIDNEVEVNNKEFQEMLKYIKLNYNHKLHLNELAENFYLNSNYCCYLFNRYLNTSFSQYVTDLRMKQAGQLLNVKTVSIDEVARAVGYDDYYYFNKVFKKYYGITPLQYKKKNI